MLGFMAMAQKIKKRTINLIPNKGDSLLNQFLSWALSVGRLLIIVTETLALSVFFYRFTLDVQIIDLHDKIIAASNIVQGFNQNEQLFRNIQSRIAFAEQYDAEKATTIDLVKDVLALGQNKITFTNLIVNQNTIEIEATAPYANLLAEFTQELNTHPQIQEVFVNRVENKTSSGITIVGISAKIRTKPTPAQASAQQAIESNQL